MTDKVKSVVELCIGVFVLIGGISAAIYFFQTDVEAEASHTLIIKDRVAEDEDIREDFARADSSIEELMAQITGRILDVFDQDRVDRLRREIRSIQDRQTLEEMNEKTLAYWNGRIEELNRTISCIQKELNNCGA